MFFTTYVHFFSRANLAALFSCTCCIVPWLAPGGLSSLSENTGESTRWLGWLGMFLMG